MSLQIVARMKRYKEKDVMPVYHLLAKQYTLPFKTTAILCSGSLLTLKATTGVCEAHLLQAYKPCVIVAIPTKPYWKVRWWSP